MPPGLGRELRRLLPDGGGLTDGDLVGHFIPMYWAIAQQSGVGIVRTLLERAFLQGSRSN
jgi:hypothetical protein